MRRANSLIIVPIGIVAILILVAVFVVNLDFTQVAEGAFNSLSLPVHFFRMTEQTARSSVLGLSSFVVCHVHSPVSIPAQHEIGDRG